MKCRPRYGLCGESARKRSAAKAQISEPNFEPGQRPSRAFPGSTVSARDSNLPAILASGAIDPNTDGTLPTTFGHSSHGFRKRGCVSLFDLRHPRPSEDYLYKCYPFGPIADDGIAIFIFSADACGDLLAWTLWKDEQA
jgi:hypothetical protein